MSHEYSICLVEPIADLILVDLRSSVMFAYEKADHIALKDQNGGTSWNHDVRLFKENDFKFFWKLLFRQVLCIFYLRIHFQVMNIGLLNMRTKKLFHWKMFLISKNFN